MKHRYVASRLSPVSEPKMAKVVARAFLQSLPMGWAKDACSTNAMLAGAIGRGVAQALKTGSGKVRS